MGNWREILNIHINTHAQGNLVFMDQKEMDLMQK